MQTPLTFLAAFIVVLALIGLTAWLVRRFSGSNLGNAARGGRMPRLAVIDAAAVDGRRRLVLVRRDNVEHLLMIGGPTDVVVELNIVRAMPARDGAPQRPGELPRSPSITDGPAWTDGNAADDLDAPEPAVEPPPSRRGGGASFADEVRRPVPQGERRNFDPASLAPDVPPARSEPPARNEPPAMPSRPARPPRPESRAPRLAETLARLPRAPEAPPAAPPVAPATPSSPSVDEKELSDMAQRLEAALRRPSAPLVVSPSAEPVSTSSAPNVEAPRPPRPTSAAPPVTPPDAPAAGPATKAGFENLEDEMASLLGRPKSP